MRILFFCFLTIPVAPAFFFLLDGCSRGSITNERIIGYSGGDFKSSPIRGS
jgi:hypothetical protein